MRALCATRPPEWWDVGDGGNRLAMQLCGVCPLRDTCARLVPHPAGVIVAGVAYSDAGTALPVCERCGYPVVGYLGGTPRCPWCDVRSLPRLPRRLYWRARYRQQMLAKRRAAEVAA